MALIKCPVSSCQNWTNAMSLSPACPAATWTVCSPSSTLPHAWQLARSATTTSLRSLPTSTGCASSTSCAYWFTSAFRGPHRATCRTPSARSWVRNHGVACVPRHRPISSCRRRDVQQWATMPLPSQVHVLGTTCLTRFIAAHCWLSLNVFCTQCFYWHSFSSYFSFHLLDHVLWHSVQYVWNNL